MSVLSELSVMAEVDMMSDELMMDDPWENMQETEPMDRLYDSQEAMALEADSEIRTDLPNCDRALVVGNPYQAAEVVDYAQGDNSFDARGNCGLLSISNMLCAGGYEMTEEQITDYAIKNRLCNFSTSDNPCDNGATNAEKRKELLQRMGIESDICPSGSTGSLECIVDAIDSGRGVVISVNSGGLWDVDNGSPLVNGKPVTDHCVAVTGYARNADTGEIAGVYIADSGRGDSGDACRYLTVEEFDDVYTNAYNSRANITRLPLKGV